MNALELVFLEHSGESSSKRGNRDGLESGNFRAVTNISSRFVVFPLHFRDLQWISYLFLANS